MRRIAILVAALLFIPLVPRSPELPCTCFELFGNEGPGQTVRAWELPSWGGAPAHAAGALDDRAPVTVQASPRALFALHIILNQQAFKGDDQDAESRISEALGFAAIDARSKAITKEKAATSECRAARAADPRNASSSCEANGEDFSDKLGPKTLPKDDAGRVFDWLRAASLPGAFNEILAPLVRELRRASGK